ncbi:hypothetical protein [Sorangium sp. So ce117]|uniref:hypothetical protein n=1 Tax=Sorangium sp. So ce117 TaxID=3133277 RepID=UPI003F60FBC8
MRSRKLRDAAYTLVVNAERRLRAAAEYGYAGTDKMSLAPPLAILGADLEELLDILRRSAIVALGAWRTRSA